ncbi:MAG: hypothetical protein JW812_00380 [Alphaproteobacteria bacterium]|nr:hypothetical protein [Alphaproteobacteria bacterium]MBN2779625.1 hypothetical protein [Alphaproteobacteria bacterium]
MSDITKLKSWSNLKKHQVFLSDNTLKDMFMEDTQRAEKYIHENDHFFLDYSKTHMDEKAVNLLKKFAEDRELNKHFKALFAGDRVNTSQSRAALHYAWRAPDAEDIRFDSRPVMPELAETRNQMKDFCEAVHTGEKTGATGKRFFDIIHVGIGGSSTSVKYLTQALSEHKKAGIGLYILESTDMSALKEIKTKLNPETTLVVVATKSFRTRETLLNASYLKEWMDDAMGTGAHRQHMVAATANVKNAHQFGILEEHIFAFKSWVGGRFGTFCPTSITIPLLCGWEVYKRTMDGAYVIDKEMKETEITDTLAFQMAMVSFWYRSFWNTAAEGIFPYLKTMEGIVYVAQMMEMESNGKPGSVPTSPFLYGVNGTRVEHNLFQKLLQSDEKSLSTFVLVGKSDKEDKDEFYRVINSHALGFMEALALGKEKTKDMNAAEVCSGNQPSIALILKGNSPEAIGGMLALLEYKAICCGFLWDINSFDDFGALAGKDVAQTILQAKKTANPSTNALIKRLGL